MAGRTAAGDRSGYWFSLVLLGFGLLVLLGWETAVRNGDDFAWFAYGPDVHEGTYENTEGLAVATLYGSAIVEYPAAPEPEWPWAVLLAASLVGTAVWYGVRARRAGRSARAHVVLAVAGGFGVPVMFVLVDVAAVVGGGQELVSSVGVPLVLLGALAGAWAYFLRGRPRKAVAAVGVTCAGAGVATVLGAWAPELLVPVLVAGGLATLAWLERSGVVAAVAVVVPAVLVVLADDVLRLLVPAVVLLVAAIVALARRTAGAAPETG